MIERKKKIKTKKKDNLVNFQTVGFEQNLI